MNNEINNKLIPTTQNKNVDLVNEIKYVVIRNGCRVSDKEYYFFDDAEALSERNFWIKAAHNEKVEIVVYEPKKHKVW